MLENVGRLGICKLRVCPHIDFRERGRPRPHQPDTRFTPVSFTQTRRPNSHRLGAGKNARAPAGRWKQQRPQERGRPRPHQPDTRSCDSSESRKSDGDLGFTPDRWPEQPPKRQRRGLIPAWGAAPRRAPTFPSTIQGLKARPITFPFAYFDYFVVENVGLLGIRKLRVCPHIDFLVIIRRTGPRRFDIRPLLLYLSYQR
ncbi:MAG: hypothetical protein GX456_09430 [Verrucomicrobia bacterium]|nr:hypothetical protein [Verrucomicrobiota bacterium]